MPTKNKAPSIRAGNHHFILNARPDTIDFRDCMYVPTLVNVPSLRSVDDFRKAEVEIRNQGQEGACTGFALAAVADYLMHTRRPRRESGKVSAAMLYTMARRYDEWPGEGYDGSSARGAMKGWFQHGVCAEALWPATNDTSVSMQERSADAIARPLGAYYRVDHSDLVAMHAAIAEVGVVYATAQVHEGWSDVGEDGIVKLSDTIIGGHAFAIVGYDSEGFWFQNSWGEEWGDGGFGRIGYADWLRNGTDVWVGRLGVPLKLDRAALQSTAQLSGSRANAMDEVDAHLLRPHIISLGDNGQFDQHGRFGNSLADIAHILDEDFNRITAGWPTRRLALYAHGGLHSEADAVEHIKHFREAFLAQQIYPISIIWHSDLESTVANLVKDSLQKRRPEAFLGGAKDFMFDRIDDTIEPLARNIGVKTLWEEMKQNARMASTTADGGLHQILDLLPQNAELHLIGHSAGAIMHAHLADALAKKQRQVATCTLWAPACTMALFNSTYVPLLNSGSIAHMNLFVLSDKAEQDDSCADVYHKSLLYLVSNALERTPHIPFRQDGEALLGLEIDLNDVKASLPPTLEVVVAPNRQDDRDGSQAKRHGDFDDDPTTVKATLMRILGVTRAPAQAKASATARPTTPAAPEVPAPLPSRCLTARRYELKREMHW
jgi:hypothetical protein